MVWRWFGHPFPRGWWWWWVGREDSRGDWWWGICADFLLNWWRIRQFLTRKSRLNLASAVLIVA